MTRRAPAQRTFNALAPAILCLGLLISGPAQANRLSGATSPYLLMHADDAIEWYPWGQQALEKAKAENKLIFLSIGYASCYWCHVMARVTFSDSRVISTLNEHYVSILVDREERPDLDHHFMAVMLALWGQSGYPANFVLTPDGAPVIAVGYLAPDPAFGQPGFVDAAQATAKEWKRNENALLKDAEETRRQLRSTFGAVRLSDGEAKEDPRQLAARAWSGRFDKTYGGFGRGAKFIQTNVLSFLLRHGVRTGDRGLAGDVLRTLDHMAAGGVRDHLGGAFHRYAVDRFWQVPHFEIMLDENAQIARLYLEAFQATGEARYAAVAKAILDDLLDRFRLPGGGFASALDAETHQTQGMFYTWTADEVRSVLGAEKAAAFIEAYVDEAYGLVQGRSVLRILKDPQSLLLKQSSLKDSLSRLRRARATREAPRRDEKVLTSWTALAISAFAKAAQVFDDKSYLQVAREEMHRLLEGASNPSPGPPRIFHSRFGEFVNERVFLDDYAFLIQALLDLYETVFEIKYLDNARLLMKPLIERFQKEPGMAFQFTPLDQAQDIAARIILVEESIPSGNAAAVIALHRLALFDGGQGSMAGQAEAIVRSLGGYMERSSQDVTGLIRALDYKPTEAREIIIVGEMEDPHTRRLLNEVHKRLITGTVLAVIAPNAAATNDRWPLLAGRPLLDGIPTAYVCKNRICDLPVNTVADLASLLDKLVLRSPKN